MFVEDIDKVIYDACRSELLSGSEVVIKDKRDEKIHLSYRTLKAGRPYQVSPFSNACKTRLPEAAHRGAPPST
jgi:hypothetical protein